MLVVNHPWDGPIIRVGFAGLSGAIFLAAHAANEFGGPSRKAFSWPGLTFAGRISYGLNRCHLPSFLALRMKGYPNEPSATGVVALAVGLAISIAALLHYALEKPLLRWAALRAGVPRPAPPPLGDPTAPAGLVAR